MVDVLRQLGVVIKQEDEVRIQKAKEEHPEIRTEDIIVQLDIAPEKTVQKAAEIAKKGGSFDMLMDRFKAAKVSIQGASDASRQLAQVAGQIAKKR